MRRNWKKIVMGGLALACGGMVSMAQSAQPVPVTFNTYARVAVDEAGHATSVEIDDPDLPAPIRAFLASRVGQLPFSPPERGGARGDAVTWVQVGACASPLPDGTYRLGMDVLGNGPQPKLQETRLPEYPKQALTAGDGGSFLMTIQVDSDGSARLLELEQTEGSRQHFAKFRQSLRDYIADTRFEPEQLAGVPVASRIEMRIGFGTSVEGRDAHLRRLREERLDAVLRSRECEAARGGPASGIAIALDSPVKFAPGG